MPVTVPLLKYSLNFRTNVPVVLVFGDCVYVSYSTPFPNGPEQVTKPKISPGAEAVAGRSTRFLLWHVTFRPFDLAMAGPAAAVHTAVAATAHAITLLRTPNLPSLAQPWWWRAPRY